MFQSSPGLMAGRYPGWMPFSWAFTVSILARLNGRALPFQIVYAGHRGGVSILARLNGRALQRCTGTSIRPSPFQSSPGLMAGRYGRPAILYRYALGFNPRPA